MRWTIGLALLAALALTGRWVAHLVTDGGPPVGDRWARRGAGLPLDQATASYGLDLPSEAMDLRHLARLDPENGRLHLAVALRSTRAAMTDYLERNGTA
ncbi:hypothetical protein [Kitasatospora sp. NPDC059673]|uniref:hypothetical protein n=1 Tax=Kitasatospora sp. NPDC059673 TaxID=3346901 RepID=UPI00368B8F7B